MAVLVALLRAVNVGGTGKLPMADLRAMCDAAGFAEARTYIQSGNVVFRTDRTVADAKSELEAGLRDLILKPVSVIVRTADEMRSLVERNPFPEAARGKVAVLFHDRGLPPDYLGTATGKSDEEIAMGEREIVIHYPGGMGRSRLWLSVMDSGTMRNMNTVAKLAAMAAGAG